MSQVQAVLMQLPPLFSDQWRQLHSLILEEEHWLALAQRMPMYAKGEIPQQFFLPEFNEEILPPLENIRQYFQSLCIKTEASSVFDIAPLLEEWREAVEEAPFDYLLAILGQRFTSASLRDHSAIPPLEKTLLESAFQPYNRQITVATRAWEKHIGRSKEPFWGEMKGNAQAKDQRVRKLIRKMIQHKTWWNVFGHYQFDTVYEIRVASGHGIRWKHGGRELIGFLEPFLADKDER